MICLCFKYIFLLFILFFPIAVQAKTNTSNASPKPVLKPIDISQAKTDSSMLQSGQAATQQMMPQQQYMQSPMQTQMPPQNLPYQSMPYQNHNVQYSNMQQVMPPPQTLPYQNQQYQNVPYQQNNQYQNYPNYQNRPQQYQSFPTRYYQGQYQNPPDFSPIMLNPSSNASPSPQPLAPAPVLPAQLLDADRIGRLEKIVFGYMYPEHDLTDRLDHLDMEVFAKRNSGDMSSRLKDLEAKIGLNQGAFGGAHAHAMPNPHLIPQTTAQAMPHITPQVSHNQSFEQIVQAIPYEDKAGDYFSNIQKFPGNTYAHWTKFPISVHLPEGSPDSWRLQLEAGLKRWGQYIPIKIVSVAQPADIEIAWINHLPPGQLGLTNLEIFNGKMRVTVYLLRPNYYLSHIPEKTLQDIALHEFGHAIGIFGHSSAKEDVMQSIGISGNKSNYKAKFGVITARDINTLKRIYQFPGLSPGFQSPQPLGWP